MAEEGQKKMETQTSRESATPPTPETPPAQEQPIPKEDLALPTKEGVTEEKAETSPSTQKALTEQKAETSPTKKPADDDGDSKGLVVVENDPVSADEKKPAEGSIHRDAVLARVSTEKRISLIRAWEDNEKSKVDNKAHKKMSAIDSWENSKKASIAAELKSIEEKLEKKKAQYEEKMRNKIAMIHKAAEENKAIVEANRGQEKAQYEEKMRNKIAMIHKAAEENKAIVEANRGQELLKVEEKAAKYRATGTTPKKLFGFF